MGKIPQVKKKLLSPGKQWAAAVQLPAIIADFKN